MVLMFSPEDRERARWLEAVPSSARSHDLLSSPQQNLPVHFCTGSILAEEGWARSVASPSRKASPFQMLEREPGQGKPERERGPAGVGEGRRVAHHVPSAPEWVGSPGCRGREAGRGCPGRNKAVSSVLGRRQVWLPAYLR